MKGNNHHFSCGMVHYKPVKLEKSGQNVAKSILQLDDRTPMSFPHVTSHAEPVAARKAFFATAEPISTSSFALMLACGTSHQPPLAMRSHAPRSRSNRRS
mmetsp:Transcript_98082/g.189397  ORF Transcript_98082/g.189397 Transcript_98082/m.189397 type:complete len:100 (-) Transcript_98082:109-408(-)